MKLFACIAIFFVFISCQNETSTDQKSADTISPSTSASEQLSENKPKGKYKIFDCYDGTQKEMNLCARHEYKYLDSILIQKHNSLIVSLNFKIKEDPNNESLKTIKERYLSAQKLWILLKNKNVAIIKEQYHDGSIVPMAIDLQRSMDTRQRIEYIDALSYGFR